MQGVLTPGRRTALCLALAALTPSSLALEAGPVEVRSALGERLDARIPLKTRAGEWFHATCLSLTPDGSQPSLPALAAGSLSVERRRSSTHLRVRSAEPLSEPAFAFGITSTCTGTTQALAAFTVLLDPPRTRAVDAPPRPRARRGVDMARAPAERPSTTTRPEPLAARPETPAARSQPPAARSQPTAAESRAPRAEVAPATAAAAGAQYVLRLSSAPMDLARTRQFDEKSRAVLRERLRLLDTDDQVAEMLSMRDNLRRLEARVAELQLKLAAMPESFPKAAAPAPAPASAPMLPPQQAQARPQAAAPPAPASAPAADAAPPAPSGPPASSPVAPSVPAPAVPVAPAPGVLAALESVTGRLVALGIALLVLVALLGGWLWTRLRNAPRRAQAEVDVESEATVLMAPEELARDEPPIEIAAPARPEVTSDTALATRLEEDTEALRRRYIEERFPEVRTGSIVLDDPGSVVKGARLFYEDGAMPRAVELLRFAIEDRPDEVRPWLALFEIYRLERLAGEYADLAGRFRDRHEATPNWAKVRAFGRELDPSNPLYAEPATRTLETIGPREARRAAAAHADPIAENWLEAPMDFENEVLATELRRTLMARAGVDERDLIPNPMPALRSVEMFPVG